MANALDPPKIKLRLILKDGFSALLRNAAWVKPFWGVGQSPAKIGSTLGEVKTECINGSVAVTLAKVPTNLTFTEDVAHNGSAKLPDGWKGGRTIGNGKPKLSISALNGDISLRFGSGK